MRNSFEKLVIWQALQVLPGQPIVRSMVPPLYITTASGHSGYPGKHKNVLVSSSRGHSSFK